MPFKDPERRREYDRQRYRDRHIPKRDPNTPPKWVTRDDYSSSVRIPLKIVSEMRQNELIESTREKRAMRSFNKMITDLIIEHNDNAYRRRGPAF